MASVLAIRIAPGEIPLPTHIENNLIEIAKLVNIDKYGAPYDSFEPFEISEIRNNVNVISSPKGEERNLPVVRTVGRYTKLYGVVYIVKMDEKYNFVDLSNDECVDYCVKFLPQTIKLEDLGFSPINYDTP